MKSPEPKEEPQEELPFSARDAKRLADLTYRQLHIWEEKGILPIKRGDIDSWRRFSISQMFVLMVCSELRRRFGVPLDKLKSLRKGLMADEEGFYCHVIRIMSLMGTPVFLYTNLDDMIEVNSDIEIGNLMRLSWFTSERMDSLVFLKLNPIVNRLLGMGKEPIHIPQDESYRHSMLRRESKNHARSPEELIILEALREGRYLELTIKTKGGEIQHVTAAEDLPTSDLNRIQELLKENKYQQFELTQTDGQVVRLVRKVSFKPSKKGPA